MTSNIVRTLVVTGSLTVALYLGLQLMRRTFDGHYTQYVNADIAAVRAQNLLLGEYRTTCGSSDLSDIRAYASRPTTKELGYLLVGTRIIVPDAVTVTVTAGDTGVAERFESVPLLAFDDGAGIYMGMDGGDKPIRAIREENVTEVYSPNIDLCCFSHRSRVPERFWLTSSDGERLCEFTLDEATRRDVPPQTRWTW